MAHRVVRGGPNQGVDEHSTRANPPSRHYEPQSASRIPPPSPPPTSDLPASAFLAALATCAPPAYALATLVAVSALPSGDDDVTSVLGGGLTFLGVQGWKLAHVDVMIGNGAAAEVRECRPPTTPPQNPTPAMLLLCRRARLAPAHLDAPTLLASLWLLEAMTDQAGRVWLR